MPPKKSTKATLISSASDDNDNNSSDDASLVPSTDRKPTANTRISVESSAIKKSRGRPRKQPVQHPSGIPEDDDTLSAASQQDPLLDAKKEVPIEQQQKDKTKGKTKAPTEGDLPTKTKTTMTTNPTKTIPSRKKAADQKIEIPETQVVAGEDSESEGEGDVDMSDDDDDDREPDPPAPATNKEKTKRSKAGKAPVKPDADGLADELAQLKIKYEKLRRLQTDHADAIHDEQIKALEERDKASQSIIKNLKDELKSRSVSLQQFQEKETRIQELEKQNSLMEDKIERLLQDHAVLSAKLETARNIGKTPSNNSKAIAPSGASKEFSQHRENLYSDLCGLIVVNVKSDEDGGIEYDCLSTGKNGALHFKLQLDAEDDEDDEDDDGPYFTYNPMLERGRDERLIAVLPPIFRDEMNFKRTRGVDFYLQLMQSLQSS
ncbi:hypothetical protein TWF730_004091 [Orbilia blumenaviensis]|uniref:Monopolin complex subunit Csm1/Pcs1 C-terminal domain-containing protein n=1 Tax=Orbilia blumenaviensis TaxID=1796055 RepID=A0AAV9U1T6_9PEZI